MKSKSDRAESSFITQLFFRLLPVQILLIAIGCLNSVIDGAVASAAIGPDAMSVLGLYSPAGKLMDAFTAVFLGGTQILCGRFLGKHEVERTQEAFSLDVVLYLGISGLLMLFALGIPSACAGVLGARGPLKEQLAAYLVGMSFGMPAQMVGAQMSAFLQLERKEKRTYLGIAVMVVLNVGLDFLLVNVLKTGFLGLGLATSLSTWAFCAVQMQFFLTDRATIRFRFRSVRFGWLKELLRLGIPGALVQGCLMLRGLILNTILLTWCAPWGMPAFSAVNTFGCLYCAVYLGMGSAIRLLSSVYAGEEDRESLRILMKTALTKGLAAVAGVALLTFLLAEPFTRIFFSPADGAYGPALLFFRIFPLSVPVSAFFIFFNNYYQSMGRMRIVNFLSTMDGVVSNSLISLALAPLMGYLGVWIAQVAAGILTALMIPVCAGIVLRRIPRGLKDLMLLPEDFGVPEEDRMELTVTDTAQALQTSGQVIDFCLAHGTDRRRAAAAGLCLEEMAVNVIQHGFRPGHEDRVMVRVVYKEDSLMIRLKDSCPPFNPKERAELFDPEDRAHNVGIQLAARLSKKMEYEFILGLNVLTLTL